MSLYAMDLRELSTVLAALRFYQSHLEASLSHSFESALEEIATDGGCFEALAAAEIDTLCERINGGGIDSSASYHLLVVHGDVEPELRGPFDTGMERDYEALLHRSIKGDDDGLFKVESVPGRQRLTVTPYSSGFFEQHLFRNFYKHCGEEWNDTWSSMCNDECPKCRAEVEPSDSEDLEIQEDES